MQNIFSFNWEVGNPTTYLVTLNSLTSLTLIELSNLLLQRQEVGDRDLESQYQFWYLSSSFFFFWFTYHYRDLLKFQKLFFLSYYHLSVTSSVYIGKSESVQGSLTPKWCPSWYSLLVFLERAEDNEICVEKWGGNGKKIEILRASMPMEGCRVPCAMNVNLRTN